MVNLGKKLAKKLLPTAAVRKFEGLRSKPRPNSYAPGESYAVVVAAYNVAPYLNDFFQSVVDQTIKRKALHVIVVDDGSTDDTAAIIREWQKKYPRLIEGVFQEHEGPYAARNRGFENVQSTWVTFADADDFFAPNYFEEVDRSLRQHPDAMLASCKTVYFIEQKNEARDAHSLRKSFKKDNRYYALDDEKMPIVESAATSFFKVSELRKQGLVFEEGRSTFEDAYFVNKYLLDLEYGEVGFLAKPVYYFRKRKSNDSLSNESWDSADKFLSQPRQGHLALMDYASSRKGLVPDYVQRAIFHDLAAYFKRCVGRPERTQFLDEEQNEEAYSALCEVTSRLDSDVLFEMGGEEISFAQKIALCEGLMGEEPPVQRLFLQRIDLEKKYLHFRAFDGEVQCLLDGAPQHPVTKKRTDRTFLGEHLYNTYELFYQYDNLQQEIEFRSSAGVPVVISAAKKPFKVPVEIEKLVERFTKDWSEYANDGLWIVMDRDTQADDNGEHLYRYIMNAHPEQECYFVLEKESKDWSRLHQEGFKLVEYGSAECDDLFRRASKIISSQINPFVASYFGDSYHFSKKFAFLQHGVIRSDLSGWLNDHRVIDVMLTTTPAETESIVADGSAYDLTAREVAMTGLPRHDSLLRKSREAQDAVRTLLVMPTWRKWICGSSPGSATELSDDFLDSEYKKAWEEFLESNFVRELAESGVRVVFFPHPNVFPYIEANWFRVPNWVEVGSADGSISIQDYLAQASIFVTDYSSTLFDAAYLETPSVYYQFDRDEFFSGKHTSSVGYFDDERDGFGPIVLNQQELELAVREIVDNGYKPSEKYLQRMNETFPWRDGLCCQRAYEVIDAL